MRQRFSAGQTYVLQAMLVGAAAFALSVFAIVAALHVIHVAPAPDTSGIKSMITVSHYPKRQEIVYYLVSFMLVVLCSVLTVLEWRKVAVSFGRAGGLTTEDGLALAALTLLPAPILLLRSLSNGDLFLSVWNVFTCVMFVLAAQAIVGYALSFRGRSSK